MSSKMSSTKTSNIAVPLKSLRGRVIKERTVLKTPSIVKVKIPFRKKSDSATIDSVENINVNVEDVKIGKVAKPVRRKHAKPNKDLYIILPNEVAHAQLAKKPKNIDIIYPGNSDITLNENTVSKNSIMKNSQKRSVKNQIANKNEEIDVKLKTPQKRNVKKVKKLVNSGDNDTSMMMLEEPLEKVRISKSPTKNKTLKVPKQRKSKKVAERESLKEQTISNYKDKYEDTALESIPQVQESKTTRKRKLNVNKKTLGKAGPRSKTKLNNVKVNNYLEAVPNEEASLNTSVYDKIIEVEISKADGNEITDFRRSSMTSMSELSWTRDISSCSTTTCVTVSSNDFIRIDKKMPVLKLTNIKSSTYKGQIKKPLVNNFNSREESAIDNCLLERGEISLPTSSLSSLKLSSISSKSSTPKSNKVNDCNQVVNKSIKIKKMLDKLSSNLKKIDLEVVSWIGYTNEFSSDVECLKTKLLRDNILCEEREALVLFKKTQFLLLKYQETDSLKQVNNKIKPAVISTVLYNESNDQPNTEIIKPIDDQVSYKNYLNQPDDEIKQSIDQLNLRNDQDSPRKIQLKHCNNQLNEPIEKAIKDTGQTTEKIEHTNDVKQSTVHKTSIDRETFKELDNDDDDALSLYAESITGIESSRRNSSLPCASVVQDSEEYVPQYVSSDPFKFPVTTVYQPSKIKRIDQEDMNKTVLNVCEKQNADSTSIHKEFESVNNSQENALACGKIGDDTDNTENTENTKNSVPNPPCLMDSVLKPMLAVKSSVFKGVCFFNLISCCNKMVCKFPHNSLLIKDVQNRLKSLTEEQFLQEYMLMRIWPELRRQYGLCYVEECLTRNNPRILVEMAIDFIIKANSNYNDDSVLKLAAAEYTLLYLNRTDLNVCADLLNYNIYPAKNMLLCDFFMTTIAETPNFSRFKAVFIKLTQFMCVNHNKTFSLEVTAQFLERICILPYDELLAWAMIEIIKRTEMSIFSNSMMKAFEIYLSKSNPTLHEELLSIIQHASSSGPAVTVRSLSPQVNLDVNGSNISTNHIDQDIRYSPDTTNFENLNKSAVEPKFKRTINLNKIQLYLNNPSTSTATTSDYGVRGQSPKVTFNNWNGVQSHFRPRFDARGMRPPPPPPPHRPDLKRRLDQNMAYDGNPIVPIAQEKILVWDQVNLCFCVFGGIPNPLAASPLLMP